LALLVSALCLLAAGAIALRAANTRGFPAFSSAAADKAKSNPQIHHPERSVPL